MAFGSCCCFSLPTPPPLPCSPPSNWGSSRSSPSCDSSRCCLANFSAVELPGQPGTPLVSSLLVMANLGLLCWLLAILGGRLASVGRACCLCCRHLIVALSSYWCRSFSILAQANCVGELWFASSGSVAHVGHSSHMCRRGQSRGIPCEPRHSSFSCNHVHSV